MEDSSPTTGCTILLLDSTKVAVILITVTVMMVQVVEGNMLYGTFQEEKMSS
jgi:hypothetical protein